MSPSTPDDCLLPEDAPTEVSLREAFHSTYYNEVRGEEVTFGGFKVAGEYYVHYPKWLLEGKRLWRLVVHSEKV